MSFPRWPESLDSDNPVGKIYTFRIALADGDSLSSASVDVVDPTSSTIDPDPATAVSEVTFAQVSGDLYGVSFRAIGGVAGFVCIRCRYSTALGNGDDATWRLLIEQR